MGDISSIRLQLEEVCYNSQVERYKKSRLMLSQGTIDELEDMQELLSTCNPEFGQHIC